MKLPAREQRVLDALERVLQVTEPRLHAMFAMFARLTRGEELSGAERLSRGRLFCRRLSRRRPAWRRLAVFRLTLLRPVRRRAGTPAMLVSVVAGIVLMTGLVIGVAAGGASACGFGYAPAASQSPAAARCAAPPARVPANNGPGQLGLSK